MNSEVSTANSLYLGYTPFSLANKAETLIASSDNIPAIKSHIAIASSESYLSSIFISISAIPITPIPICLQSLTVSLCICNGCKGKPSSNTSFIALTIVCISFLNSIASNIPSSPTYSDKFILPNKQLPPSGRGSSAQGLTPAYSKSLS